jgi:2-amino-4-hydroxy-6-hydroxymethyldihydropteridine diphosphokinase
MTNYRSLTYLGLGSNLGDRAENIRKALALISERAGEILALSDFYETEPWGYSSPEIYLNMAVGIETKLSPEEVLQTTQEIERKMGRSTKTVDGNYCDRLIDIDILLYDDLIIQTPALIIPHPLMCQREFVLQPLSEIAPNVIHPVLGKTIAELYLNGMGSPA